jgi:hypothetical protein
MAAFEDAFVVGADTLLTAHIPSKGVGWTLKSGENANLVVRAVSNALVSTSVTRTLVTSDDLGSADCYVEAGLSTLSAQNGRYVALRIQDATNFIGFILAGTGSAGLRLVKVVGGTTTNLMTMQGVAGRVYKIEAEGSIIRFYEDGIQQGSDITESVFQAETKQGIVAFNTASTTDFISSYNADVLGGGISIAVTLGTIEYNSNDTVIGLAGNVDITTTLGSINYLSNDTSIQVSGDVNVIATLGAINYASSDTVVSLFGNVDVTATLGTIDYNSNDASISLLGGINVSAALGAIDYTSNDTTITLQGQVALITTLGTISYDSNNVIVQIGTGQAIGNVTAGFADNLYSAGFKPGEITVNFKT